MRLSFALCILLGLSASAAFWLTSDRGAVRYTVAPGPCFVMTGGEGGATLFRLHEPCRETVRRARLDDLVLEREATHDWAGVSWRRCEIVRQGQGVDRYWSGTVGYFGLLIGVGLAPSLLCPIGYGAAVLLGMPGRGQTVKGGAP